ncbi:uncharacterized protein LOC113311713 [Papaver somniferum]|uniref:uncharacterized protein LOC113311713 n=1 Tax=Papaver somniferum TaxID=3469 RepID=UPI000E6FDFF9|nr:uncharacterized protein LOC113311713 [Papaver somniferum]
MNLQQTKFVDAAVILRQQWKLTGDSKLIPLGRGFFTIKLDNETDRQYIKGGKWEVLNQILQIRKWISNFRSKSQKTSKDMVWVRLPGLGLEFWSEKILFKICKEIGTPIKLDEAIAKCEVGYYANVLVEVDFANTIPNKVWIGTKYGGFFLQNISIPVCPKFCSTCKIVEYSITECRVEKNKLQQASNAQVASSLASTNINSGRFNSLNQEELEEDDVISVDEEILAEMEPQKKIHITEDTEVDSVVKFGNVFSTIISTKGKHKNQNMEVEKTDQVSGVVNLFNIAEANSLQNSTVNFVNGSNGKVTN